MKIKIIKNIMDIRDESIRPIKGKVYEVTDVKPARFNPCKNKGYIIKVNGKEVMIFADECEVLEVDKRKVVKR